MMKTGGLTTGDGNFLLDGRDWQWLSGAIHYFRVPREYWRDRLEKLAAMGCDAVETYVPWNLHEPLPGRFDFDGDLDLLAFLRLAEELGLKCVVRPSPYICGEFEFGGLPWWLLEDPALRVRTPGGSFEAALRRWYAELLPRLAPLQATRGGPLVACQLENEYGYYGNNTDYLRMVEGLLRGCGIEVLLFTVDGPWGEALEAGSLEGVLATGSFGSGAPAHFKRMRALRPGDPLVCGEFWMGWFDTWGEPRHLRDPADAARALEEILEEGHVNLYMFHGGTNFGFTSGANHYEELKPDVTSYDYDAPLSECGDPTPKYFAFREVIARKARDPATRERLSRPWTEERFSTRIVKRTFGLLEASGEADLFSMLPHIARPVLADRPLRMEELGQGYGYVLYRATLLGPRRLERCVLVDCHDRAVVLVDGAVARVLEAPRTGEPFALELGEKSNTLDLLVENLGRVNFGERLDVQRKGLGALVVDRHAHCHIESWSLPFDRPPILDWSAPPTERIPAVTAPGATVESAGRPGFTRFSFDRAGTEGSFEDSFLALPGWGKGLAWINGRNLGRFWDLGPQVTLYVPGPWLRDGTNEIVVFESEGRRGGCIELRDRPELG